MRRVYHVRIYMCARGGHIKSLFAPTHLCHKNTTRQQKKRHHAHTSSAKFVSLEDRFNATKSLIFCSCTCVWFSCVWVLIRLDQVGTPKIDTTHIHCCHFRSLSSPIPRNSSLNSKRTPHPDLLTPLNIQRTLFVHEIIFVVDSSVWEYLESK